MAKDQVEILMQTGVSVEDLRKATMNLDCTIDLLQKAYEKGKIDGVSELQKSLNNL